MCAMKPTMKFHGEKMSPFGKLPNEMILAVLEFVDLSDKQHCRLICRRWRWILDHPDKDASIISFIAVAREIEDLEAILSSYLVFEEVHIEGVDKPWPKMTDSEHELPPIRKLFIGIENSEEIVINLLQFGCVFTEDITLDPESFGNTDLSAFSHVLSEIQWEHLSDLVLKVDIPNPNDIPNWGRKNPEDKTLKCVENHFYAAECFLSFATIPNLKVFRFSVTSTLETEFSPLTINIVSKYTTFIQRHSETKKKLYLELQLEADVFSEISDPVSALLASHQEPKPFKLNLEAMEIKASHLLVVRYLVPPCLWDLDRLTTLLWSTSYCEPDYSLLSPFPLQSLIRRNQTTIVELSVSFSNSDVENLGFTWLETCTALRKLTLENFHDTSSVKVQLPRVTTLEVRRRIWCRNLPSKVSAWITQSFRNVEIVKIIGYYEDSNSVEFEFEWLANLLPLRNLREIQLSQCTYFDDLLYEFCQDKPQLIFTPEKFFKCSDEWLSCLSCIRIISNPTSS